MGTALDGEPDERARDAVAGLLVDIDEGVVVTDDGVTRAGSRENL